MYSETHTQTHRHTDTEADRQTHTHTQNCCKKLNVIKYVKVCGATQVPNIHHFYSLFQGFSTKWKIYPCLNQPTWSSLLRPTFSNT